MSKEILQDIINNFQTEKFSNFFRDKNRDFTRKTENLREYNDSKFTDCEKLGEIKFENDNVIFVCLKSKDELTERSSKKLQYEKAKKILKEQVADAGIFIFYDSDGSFRFSLVYANYAGTRRIFSGYKRFTFYVNKNLSNKTFLHQIGTSGNNFISLEKIKDSFSITAVTDIFYTEFLKEHFEKLVNATAKFNNITEDKSWDFVLLFCIRIIFIGFIQKRKWIGNDEYFLSNFLKEYENKFSGQNKFYKRWLIPLFFQSLNNPPGKKVAYRDNEFSEKTDEILQMAPYLNGGLFKEKSNIDKDGIIIPDAEIKNFIEFLFSHSFTIEENSLEDEDLQLNPEFLGIIFERLVNKSNGAVYTPRPEVDFMCRMSLVKWLEKNTSKGIQKHNLYELFFREIGEGTDSEDVQKYGSFSDKERKEILDLLENISICDPAVGSGAFLIGMLLVLDEVICNLRNGLGISLENDFDRKEKIISNSLYGVEVQEYAVWICQLRLWISLFIDAPDELRHSTGAILPSLELKIRQGDSLVQRIGSKLIPAEGYAYFSDKVKRKMNKLKKMKIDYFYNKLELQGLPIKDKEIQIFKDIIDEEIKEILDSNEKPIEKNIFSSIRPVKKINLFTAEEKDVIQENLSPNSEITKEQKQQIEQLHFQKRILDNDKPLIWNIEFAEIFSEKNGFDLIIGNPPYVRQEEIEDPTGKIKDKKKYKTLLGEMVKLDYPKYFSSKYKIPSKSDLYIYFYFRSLKLLNEKGYHCFICSNSWLDVGYGVWFQKFLLEKTKVDFIVDNHSMRSFKSADVNTIISFINAPQKNIDKNHQIKFVAFKKPFEETIFTEYLLEIDNSEKINSNENFRVYPITINELFESGSEIEEDEDTFTKTTKFVGDKWGGKYLRAPDIFFKLLMNKNKVLIKLGKTTIVKRGITSGVNDFFYLTKEKAEKWKIEQEFLKPLFKSSRENKSIMLHYKNLSNLVFLCEKNKDEMLKTNALKYINYGETQKYNLKETVKNRKNWYALGAIKSNIFMQMSYNDIFKFWFNDNEIICDARLYTIKLNNIKEAYLLNNTISALFIELLGRGNLGEGALDFKVYEARNILVPKFDLFENINVNKNFMNREIRSIFEESGINPKSEIPIEEQEPNPLPDRAELDKIVFDALNLTEEERKEVYRAVCRLVWNRISKAKSMK